MALYYGNPRERDAEGSFDRVTSFRAAGEEKWSVFISANCVRTYKEGTKGNLGLFGRSVLILTSVGPSAVLSIELGGSVELVKV